MPSTPSPWVTRFGDRVPPGGTVLDLACGGGRHARWFLERGHPIVAADRDVSGVEDLRGRPDVDIVEVDLEDGKPFPFARALFAGVVVTNYLHQPILADVVAAVAPGGVLIYETFVRGQELLGLPRNPDFLLEPGQLLEAVRGRLRVVAFEDLVVEEPHPAAVQRICAVRSDPS